MVTTRAGRIREWSQAKESFLGAMNKLGAINLLYFFRTVLLLNTADHFLSIFTALPLV